MGLVDQYTGGQELLPVVGGYGLGLALLLAAVGFGMPMAQRNPGTRPWHVRVTLSLGLGLSAVWLLTFAAGHLGLLNRPFVVVLVAGGAVLLAVNRDEARTLIQQLWEAGLRAKLAALLLLATGAMLLLGSARPPLADDEVGYHWPSPLAWAAAGEWRKVPFRLSDGTAAMEQLYTLAAIFGSSTAAHVIHVGTLVLLCLATASVAVSLGGRGWIGAVLIVSIPAAVTQAFLSYNDVGAAAFAVAAFAVLLHVTTWEDHLAIGVLSAVAISVKPLIAVPLIVLLVAGLLQGRQDGRRFPSLRQLAVAAAPVALIGLAWLAHTTRLTGHPVPRDDGFVIARTADNPLNTIRVPTAPDVVRAPVEALWTPIAGRRSPYGGRTGGAVFLLVALLFVPDHRARLRRVIPLVGGLVLFFVVAGPFLPRTRFILPIHALLVALVCAGLGRQPRKGWGWAVLAITVVGVADASRRIIVPLL